MPPPGSQPITVTLPSHENAAECQVVTPGAVKSVSFDGAARSLMSKTTA